MNWLVNLVFSVAVEVGISEFVLELALKICKDLTGVTLIFWIVQAVTSSLGVIKVLYLNKIDFGLKRPVSRNPTASVVGGIEIAMSLCRQREAKASCLGDTPP